MPSFTADQIHTLIAALPSHIAKRKRTVLRLMLDEWGRIDLEEHLKRSTPKQTRARKNAMHLVAKRAEEFAGALASLDRTSRFAVATRLLELETGADFWSSPRERVREVEHRLADEPQKLRRLAEAAESEATRWQPLPLRHDSLIRYLLLQDLAAIFEYATSERAERQVRGKDHFEAGKDYGPFWNFASAAWTIVFGSTDGLSAAIRRWTEGRAKYGEISAVVENAHLRHPEWQILEA